MEKTALGYGADRSSSEKLAKMTMRKYLLFLEIILRSVLPPFYSFSLVEKVCRKRLLKRPDDIDAMWLLGNLYIWYGKYPEARTQLEGMRRAGIDTKTIKLLLSRVYFHLNEYEAVVQLLQDRTILVAQDVENYYLGFSLMKLERYNDAIISLEINARGNQAGEHVFASLGYSYYMAGLYENALDAYRRAAHLNPSNEEIRVNIRRCEEKLEGQRG